MGLDMWMRTTRIVPDAEVDFDLPRGSTQELHYWRKHPNLHGWMERLYRAKGGKADDFNSVYLRLTGRDLDELEKAVEGDALPETAGFFFGESDGTEAAGDLACIGKAREAIADGLTVLYTSWW